MILISGHQKCIQVEAFAGLCLVMGIMGLVHEMYLLNIEYINLDYTSN